MEKVTEELEEEKKGWFFYFSLLVLIVVLGVYFSLYFREKAIRKNIQKLEATLQERPAEIVPLEERLKDYEKKIKDFQALLQQHVLPSKILTVLEAKTHPKVKIKKANFNFEDFSLRINGVTDNFFTLGQQFLAYKTDSNFSEVGLLGVNINEKEKKVEFEIKLNFSPNLVSF
jgi:Tfp pilus assembly protein PilN